MSSSSSSLKTDSDWEEEAKKPKPAIKRNQVTYRIQENFNTDEYVNEMLEQVKDEGRLAANQSSSYDISSSFSSNRCENLSIHSDFETEQITEINNILAKRFVNALMVFKSTTRPILSSPFGKRRGGFLFSSELINTIKPLEKSFTSGEKRKKCLTESLKKIKNLEKIKKKNISCLESQLKEIKNIDSEREELKGKIETLSKSLDGIFREKRNLMKSNCNCALF
jgi:hypothetical protein